MEGTHQSIFAPPACPLPPCSKPPPVVLSEDLVRDPEGTLHALCSALDLPFDPAMLSWPAGPRPYDGAWAPWWYAQSHRSTGFQCAGRKQQQAGQEGEEEEEQQGEAEGAWEEPQSPALRRQLPSHLKPLLEECRPLWEMLRRRALRPAPRPAGSSSSSAAGGGAEGGDGEQQRQQQQQKKKNEHGTHAYKIDPRNADVLVGMRDGVTGEME